MHAVVAFALSAGPLCAGGCGGATTQDVLEPTPSGSSGTIGFTGPDGNSGSPDASVDGAALCPSEQEPNDSKETANLLAPTRCGFISPRTESDFLTFALRPTSTSMTLSFTGRVTLKVDVNGQSVLLGGRGPAQTVPFVKNHRYDIEVKGADSSDSIPWRVDLVEK